MMETGKEMERVEWISQSCPPPLLNELQALREDDEVSKTLVLPTTSFCCFVCAAKDGSINGECIPSLPTQSISSLFGSLVQLLRFIPKERKSYLAKFTREFWVIITLVIVFATAKFPDDDDNGTPGAEIQVHLSEVLKQLLILCLCLSVTMTPVLAVFCVVNTIIKVKKLKKHRFENEKRKAEANSGQRMPGIRHKHRQAKFDGYRELLTSSNRLSSLQSGSEEDELGFLSIEERNNIIYDRIMSPIRAESYADILAKAIQIPTVSKDYQTKDQDTSDDVGANILLMHKLLKERFPKLYQNYPPTVLNKYSLLFRIPGSNDDLPPIMLCAHLDVVPAPNKNEEWRHDPFSGWIDEDGMIWGRGAIDNKHNVVSILAAIEDILRFSDEDGLPPRTVYVAMGHDEEVGGSNGAQEIARHLKDTLGCMSFYYILDEGTMMVSGAIPGLPKNKHVALISIAEKGYMTVEMSIKGPGGHTSIPAVDNNTNLIAIMSRAIDRIESNPVPANFGPGSIFRKSLEYLLEHYESFPLKCVFANLWLFDSLIKFVILRANPAAAAMIRTTTAVVKISGGEKYNVMPTEVKAYINHRVHRYDTIQKILRYDRKIINDPRIKVSLVEGQTCPPAPESPHEGLPGAPFLLIQECVQSTFGYPSAPSLCIGNTDTRWYWDLSQNIYRFSPVSLTIEDTKMFHGINERISKDALAKMVLFYRTLIMDSK